MRPAPTRGIMLPMFRAMLLVLTLAANAVFAFGPPPCCLVSAACCDDGTHADTASATAAPRPPCCARHATPTAPATSTATRQPCECLGGHATLLLPIEASSPKLVAVVAAPALPVPVPTLAGGLSAPEARLDRPPFAERSPPLRL